MNLSKRGGQELQCTKNASIAKQLLKTYNLISEDQKNSKKVIRILLHV